MPADATPAYPGRPPVGTGASVELRIWRLLVTVTVVAALYFLRELIVPIAVAALVTFVLSPLVVRLERRLGRIPAVLLTIITTSILIGVFAWTSAVEIGRLAQQLPTYKANLANKMQGLNATGNERFGRVSRMFEDLLAEKAPVARGKGAPAQKIAPPLPVEVIETRSQSSARLMATAGQMLVPLGFIGAVLVLSVFMLAKHDDLRDRLIGLIGRGQLATTTAAIRDASSRVYRYLLMALIVNVSYGIPVGIGLYLIGVPSAPLWAALAIVLRFIPYLGPLIAMAFPIVLSLAVFDGWTGPLLTIALFMTLEVISNNVVEPWLYGASTGVSSFSLILAALVWTWLWGPVGLLLSTPLTVCLLVVGKHVPQLAFLRILLSDERALDAHEVFYQRVLSGDQEGAERAIVDRVPGASFVASLDSTVLPALAMAQEDLRRGALDSDRYAGAIGVMQEAADAAASGQAGEEPGKHVGGQLGEPRGNDGAAGATAPAQRAGVHVACVAVDSAADAVAAEMLALVARTRGFDATVFPSTLTADGLSRALDEAAPHVVWLCAINPENLARCGALCSGLRERHPALPLSVGIWHPSEHQSKAIARLVAKGADVVSTVFGESLMHLEAFRDTFSSDYIVAPIPDDDVERIAALMGSGLGGISGNELLDRTTAELTRVFNVPIALVTTVDADSQHFVSHQGLDPELQAARRTSRDVSVCGHVVAANRPLVVEDLARDPRFAGNPLLREKNLRFYAGVPLRTRTGHVIGSLCILDHVPRRVSEREIRLMQIIGENLMCEVEERARQPGAGE